MTNGNCSSCLPSIISLHTVEISLHLSFERTPNSVFACAAAFCLFYAFSLVDATLVRAVGQLEIVFSVLISFVFYKERITGFELIGMSLITISILALLGLLSIY